MKFKVIILFFLAAILQSCSENYDLKLDKDEEYSLRFDEEGNEYYSYEDSFSKELAQAAASDDAWLVDLPEYYHKNLFKEIPSNASWDSYGAQLFIEVDKDGDIIALETASNANSRSSWMPAGLFKENQHTDGWYFFPYSVMDSRFICYVANYTNIEMPLSINFDDVLRSPYCTVYGGKGTLKIDVKPNNTSKDRIFTITYGMSEFDIYKFVNDLDETNFQYYSQVKIVITQHH